MFLPSESSRWTGNLKKLKIYKGDSTTGCNALDIHTLGIVVDRGCDPALDDGSNRIADGRSTYWNTINDGSEVGSGGLGAALLNTRGTFYTNLVNNSGNEYLGSVDNIDVSRFGISDSANYTTANLINWIKGLDNDGNTLSWVLGVG